MKIRVEMSNSKIYNLNWQETLEFFEQEIQFAEGNKFLLTDTGKRISINKIIEWEVLEQ
jgi:hypothetical protein